MRELGGTGTQWSRGSNISIHVLNSDLRSMGYPAPQSIECSALLVSRGNSRLLIFARGKVAEALKQERKKEDICGG